MKTIDLKLNILIKIKNLNTNYIMLTDNNTKNTNLGIKTVNWKNNELMYTAKKNKENQILNIITVNFEANVCM